MEKLSSIYKTLFTESEPFNIIEDLVGEDYPSSFNMEEFKSLSNFNQRIKYCEKHLKRIASGSARIVYMIDNEKVLKLAKNQKGLAQNEIEASHSQYYDIDHLLANVFDYHQDDLWVEMELARKVRASDFYRLTGFKFSDYKKGVHNYAVDAGIIRGLGKYDMSEEMLEGMYDSEFISGIFDYISGYNAGHGDLSRLNSFGLVQRNGEEDIVIIDYGLTSDVYASYYS